MWVSLCPNSASALGRVYSGRELQSSFLLWWCPVSASPCVCQATLARAALASVFLQHLSKVQGRTSMLSGPLCVWGPQLLQTVLPIHAWSLANPEHLHWPPLATRRTATSSSHILTQVKASGHPVSLWRFPSFPRIQFTWWPPNLGTLMDTGTFQIV